MAEKIRIGFVDFWKGFDARNNCLTDMLIRIYGKNRIEVVDKNFDYLFFSCFGHSNLKYDCIKIFFTGENIVPDFNICDYAIGVHEMNFGDRYLRLPFYYWYDNAYERAVQKHKFKDSYYLNRKFCCFVISNSLADLNRQKMISLLNAYKQLDGGDKFMNNVGGPVRDKYSFVSNYKFSLCFENSKAEGYTTEKILEGFAGNSVPIYWGNPGIIQEFNEKSFINCNAYGSLEEAVEFIKEVDKDDELYLRFVKEPVFGKESTGKKEITEKKLEAFFRNIFGQNILLAGRVNRVGMGERYLRQMALLRPVYTFCSALLRMYAFCENRKRLKAKLNNKYMLWRK